MKEGEIGGEIKCERGREGGGEREERREGGMCVTYKCIWVHMYM